MDAIQLARELGKAIQQDPRYAHFREAEKTNDADMELQKMIEDFNNMKTELNAEMSKSEKDSEKIQELDEKFKTLYNDIINRPDMVVYNEAKTKLDKLLSFVNQIIIGSVNGENPDEIEEQIACTGSCSGCSGCH